MKIKSSKSKKTLKQAKSNPEKNKKLLAKSKERSSGDITSLILRDHEPIKKLILVLKDSQAGITEKQPAYTEFEKILALHAKAEEESLYIQMKKEDDLRVEGLEGDIEHALAIQLMNEIDQLKNDTDAWMAKVKVLAELVDHHVKEEEKSVFKHVRKQFDIDERIEIGKEYSKLLNQIRAEGVRKIKTTEQSNTRAEYV